MQTDEDSEPDRTGLYADSKGHPSDRPGLCVDKTGHVFDRNHHPH
jgi:hypothetical protein